VTLASAAAVPMEEAVGYPTIGCEAQTPVENELVLKHDRMFILVDAHGDIAPAGHCGLGLFHDDTRILSHYQLRLCGGPAALLSTQLLRAYAAQIDLAIKDLPFGGDPWDPKHAVHVRREYVLGDRLVERLTLTNYLERPLDYWVELRFGCDFADIFEVRGWRRPERGTFYVPAVSERAVTFRYRGVDGALVESSIAFGEPPTELAGDRARWRVRLEPNLEYRVNVRVCPGPPGSGGRVFAGGMIDRRRRELAEEYDAWQGECARWRTSNGDFRTTLATAVEDLRALYVHVDGRPVVSAGIPWYSTAFGRDSIIASFQTLSLNPRIARDTLRYLAAHQGREENPYTEEQPGRIMHEIRRGEMARSGEIPHLPYYGTIDATPLWVVLLHETWRWTADRDLVDELLPAAERALAWIDRYGDLDGDGLIEYARTSDKGLVNQGWKDSGDGVPFPDGRLPEPPIALVEVQGYAFDAKVRMADLYAALGREAAAARLRAEAERLRERILDAFWLEAAGTFALALDGRKQPIPTATSNAGHLLWSRVPTREQAARLAAQLVAPEMFSGWGIRTLSAAHRIYNPMSYHNGSVWPHDNALLVLGMAHYGHAQTALPVVRALHEAATNMPFRRLPELFCGFPRAFGLRPVLYPVSCSPQAWASGAMFMLLQAVLGIFAEAPARVLHVRNPQLPDFLDDLTVENLAIGGSRVALQFRRHGRRTLANLLGIEGEPLQVRIELS
jgi:glycogen debranching enzyme